MKKSKKHLLSILTLSSMTLLSTAVSISCSNEKPEIKNKEEIKKDNKVEEDKKTTEEVKKEDNTEIKTEEQANVNKEDKTETPKDVSTNQENQGSTGNADSRTPKTDIEKTESPNKDEPGSTSGDTFQPIGGQSGNKDSTEHNNAGAENNTADPNKEYFFSKAEFNDLNSKPFKEILSLLLENKAGFEEFRDDKFSANSPEITELDDFYLYLTKEKIDGMSNESNSYSYGHGTPMTKERILYILDGFKNI